MPISVRRGAPRSGIAARRCHDPRMTRSPVALRSTSVYGWYVVFVCTAAYVLSFVDRQILSLLIGPIKADLGISDTAFALLHGFAFSLFYATLGIPVAGLSDRTSRPVVISAGIAVWSLATAACGLAASFAGLFAARIMVGAGEAALSPASYALINDLFPRERLGRAIGVYSLGSFFGAGLSGGPVARRWRPADPCARGRGCAASACARRPLRRSGNHGNRRAGRGPLRAPAS